jgi:hypothetical protein
MVGRVLDHPTRLDRIALRLAYRLNPATSWINFTFDGDDPERLTRTYEALAFAWAFTWALVSLAWLGIWGALRGLDAIGHSALIPVFEFTLGFCMVGMLDALWRCTLTWRAQKRYRRAGRTLDSTAVHQMAVSRRRTGTVPLQLTGGLLVGFQLVTVGELYAGSFALAAVVAVIQLTS